MLQRIQAGQMRFRATVQTPPDPAAAAVDSFGQPSSAPTVLGSRWISIETLSGRELWNALQVQPDTTHRLRMRYWSLVTDKCQIVYEGRIFDILSVLDPDETKRELEIMAKEQT